MGGQDLQGTDGDLYDFLIKFIHRDKAMEISHGSVCFRLNLNVTWIAFQRRRVGGRGVR